MPVQLVLQLTLSLSASPRTLPESVCFDGGSKVRYFAFGSNLLRSKMDGRGQTEVLECEPAVAKDYRLAFNMRMFPPLEPSMASIESSLGDECEGALYTLTRDGYEALWKSEGGSMDKPGYEEVCIPVNAGGKVVSAITLRAAPWMKLKRDAPPSARYKNLIVTGAKELGLSASYISGLETLPAATPSKALTAVVRAHGVVAVLLFKASSTLKAAWLRNLLVPLRSACYALLRTRREGAGAMSRTLDVASEIATATLLLPTALMGALIRLALRLCGKEAWVQMGPPPQKAQPKLEAVGDATVMDRLPVDVNKISLTLEA